MAEVVLCTFIVTCLINVFLGMYLADSESRNESLIQHLYRIRQEKPVIGKIWLLNMVLFYISFFVIMGAIVLEKI